MKNIPLFIGALLFAIQPTITAQDNATCNNPDSVYPFSYSAASDTTLSENATYSLYAYSFTLTHIKKGRRLS